MMSMYKSEGFGLRLGLGLARRSGVRVSSSRQRALIQSPGGAGARAITGKRCIMRKKGYYHPRARPCSPGDCISALWRLELTLTPERLANPNTNLKPKP